MGKSFLKAFGMFSFEMITVEDNRAIKFNKEEYRDILTMLQNLLVIGRSRFIQNLRGLDSQK